MAKIKKEYCYYCRDYTDHLYYIRIGKNDEYQLVKCKRCKTRSPLY
jgi:hypothetical protein